jgi:hypothetical protein
VVVRVLGGQPPALAYSNALLEVVGRIAAIEKVALHPSAGVILSLRTIPVPGASALHLRTGILRFAQDDTEGER